MVRLPEDENGQTFLEYAVVLVFVVISMVIGFRLVKDIVGRSMLKESSSVEQAIGPAPDSSAEYLTSPSLTATPQPPTSPRPGAAGFRSHSNLPNDSGR